MNFSKVNYGKNSGLKSDSLDFEKQSEQPLKYYTTNWSNVLKDDAGINFHDGFRSNSSFVDAESQLIRSVVTNPKVRQNYGYLPMATTGGIAMSGPVISEELGRSGKSCQPMANEYYKRSFYDLNGFKNHTKQSNSLDTRQYGRTSLNK